MSPPQSFSKTATYTEEELASIAALVESESDPEDLAFWESASADGLEDYPWEGDFGAPATSP